MLCIVYLHRNRWELRVNIGDVVGEGGNSLRIDRIRLASHAAPPKQQDNVNGPAIRATSHCSTPTWSRMRHVDGVTVTWLACVVCHIRMDWRPSTIKAGLTRNFDRIPDWDVLEFAINVSGIFCPKVDRGTDWWEFIEISEVWGF